jgi:hypothetical protein
MINKIMKKIYRVKKIVLIFKKYKIKEKIIKIGNLNIALFI